MRITFLHNLRSVLNAYKRLYFSVIPQLFKFTRELGVNKNPNPLPPSRFIFPAINFSDLLFSRVSVYHAGDLAEFLRSSRSSGTLSPIYTIAGYVGDTVNDNGVVAVGVGGGG